MIPLAPERGAAAPEPGAAGAVDVEMVGVTKRFGPLRALDDVSLRVSAGAFHALLGENGAGKSTLVKCLVGYYQPDAGHILVGRRERDIRIPHDAHALGIGMVYQHFTLVPSMTVAENLVMSRDDVPGIVRWGRQRQRLAAFMDTVPFRVPLDAPVSSLAAGEKQKVEILKQLYRRCRFMVLDEPTSVLTPAEADEVLGMLHAMTRAGRLTVLMITHKLREVLTFADSVTVLRRSRVAGHARVADVDASTLAEMMVGTREIPSASTRADRLHGGPEMAPTLGTKGATPPSNSPGPSLGAPRQSRGAPRCSDEPPGPPYRLEICDLVVDGDVGTPAVAGVSLGVRPGEIVGIAGVSGNGQRELVEALVGQRRPVSGEVRVGGQPYRATRGQMQRHGVFSLPEEPLRNACVPELSVAENMALRTFDRPPLASGLWLRPGAVRDQAERWIAAFNVRTRGPDAPMSSLSGGNVQRAVLARELSGMVSVLIAANPVFGLDVAAVAEIHDRIVAARNAGAAVLLVSEDLDELLALADRIVVMFDGRIVHETPTAAADIAVIGQAMAGSITWGPRNGPQTPNARGAPAKP